MSALKAYLNGFGNMVKAKSDLDRLLYMPQRLENGEIFNFKNKSMFGIMDNLAGLELEVIDAKRVVEATRYTSALQRDYFEGFAKLMKLIDGEVEDTVEEEADIKEVDPVTKLYNNLYEVVAAGDKKAFRTLRKDLKDQWFALDAAEVEDAIFDLSDAVADKDVDFAKEIVERLGGESEEDTVEEEQTPTDTVAEEEGSDEVSEIIEDIKSAIDDGDEEDFKELIAELKDIDKKAYNEWKDAFSTQETKEDETEDEVVEEILEDLSIAIKEEDSDEIKELLEELAEEVGEDSELYQEWAAKVAPKKERKSRRRGK